MWEEFKKFAFRGNVIDLAVGVVIGAAFSAIVKSLVDNLIMPPIGYVLGGVDFADFYFTLKAPAGDGPFATPDDMVKAGAVLFRYGLFANAVVSFLIVATAVFLLVKGINKLAAKPPADPTTKECPHCLSEIPIKASKCRQCTADLV